MTTAPPPAPPAPPAPIDAVVVNAVLIAVRQAANVLCDRWTLLTLLLAHAGVARFGDFRDRSGMATRLLGSRLAMLEEQEVLVRMAYQRRPLRHSYHLSHMGLALFDVFVALQAWEQRWHPRRRGAGGLSIEHASCGHVATGLLPRCAACGEAVSPREVDLRINQRGIEKMPPRPTAYRRSTVSVTAGAQALEVPLAHALETFGDKWRIEVVMCAFLRVQTFGEFQAHTGMSTNILADRLARLAGAGILVQAPAPAGLRKGPYRLTAKGLDLFPILVTIEAWADAWLRERYRSPLRLTHMACGQPLRLAVRCEQCGDKLDGAACRMRVA